MGVGTVTEDGLTRSAILLMSIGEEEASEVLRHLGPREVQKLGQAMARLTRVSREQAGAVLRAFRQDAQQQSSVGGAPDQFLRNMLTRALGPDKAGMLLPRVVRGPDHDGIESLKWMEAASVAGLIGDEHPQIVAAILAQLDAEQAAEVIEQLPEALRYDVVMRIATLDAVQPAALQELNEVLARLASSDDRAKTAAARGGVEAAAAVMQRLGNTVEAAVSARIREVDPHLAQRIQEQMFAFDDLVDLDGPALQRLLHEVRPGSLLVALKGAGEALKDKLFGNLPPHDAERLREELEAMGPVRLSEIETEQGEILRVARRLAANRQIVLREAEVASFVE